MSKEEPTRSGDQKRTIQGEIERPKTGDITKVYEHTSVNDLWNFHVDVRVDEETHHRRVPVATSVPDLIAPPRSADHPDGPDMAFVEYMDDEDAEKAIVTGILYNAEDRAQLGREGIYRLRRGNLYNEVHDQGDWSRIVRKSDNEGDDGTPEFLIELDDSGADPKGRIARDADEDGTSELEVGVDGSTAYVAADPDGDGTTEAKVEIADDGTINIKNEETTGIIIENTNGGSVLVDNGAGDSQVDGQSVTLGGGGTGIIKDVSVSTTTDIDGHVTSVSLDITRSNKVSTE